MVPRVFCTKCVYRVIRACICNCSYSCSRRSTQSISIYPTQYSPISTLRVQTTRFSIYLSISIDRCSIVFSRVWSSVFRRSRVVTAWSAAAAPHAVELTRVARAGWPAPRRVRYRVAAAVAPPQLPCGGRTSRGGLEAHTEPQLKLSQAQLATTSYALALALQPSRIHAFAIALAVQSVRLQTGLQAGLQARLRQQFRQPLGLGKQAGLCCALEPELRGRVGRAQCLPTAWPLRGRGALLLRGGERRRARLLRGPAATHLPGRAVRAWLVASGATWPAGSGALCVRAEPPGEPPSVTPQPQPVSFTPLTIDPQPNTHPPLHPPTPTTPPTLHRRATHTSRWVGHGPTPSPTHTAAPHAPLPPPAR